MGWTVLNARSYVTQPCTTRADSKIESSHNILMIRRQTRFPVMFTRLKFRYDIFYINKLNYIIFIKSSRANSVLNVSISTSQYETLHGVERIVFIGKWDRSVYIRQQCSVYHQSCRKLSLLPPHLTHSWLQPCTPTTPHGPHYASLPLAPKLPTLTTISAWHRPTLRTTPYTSCNFVFSVDYQMLCHDLHVGL